MILIGKGQDERRILFNMTEFDEYGLLIVDKKEIVSAFYVNSRDDMKAILLRALELTEKGE